MWRISREIELNMQRWKVQYQQVTMDMTGPQ